MNVRRLVWTPRPCIGVDPGTIGAAAWFDGARWGTATWRNRSQAMDVLGSLGAGLGAKESPALGVEHIAYMARAKGASLITLAEAAGWAVGALGVLYAAEPARPTPGEWRRDVLGLPAATRSDDCDRVALAACRGDAVVGRDVVVDLGFAVPVRTVHEADAVCIALWAAGARLGPRGSG